MTKHLQLKILVLLLLVASGGCAVKPEVRSSQLQAGAAPNVISVPLGFSGSPTLTAEEVVSLQSQLSKAHIQSRTDLEAALPRGLPLIPVSYVLCSPLDRNGKPKPYTETISVCRLNTQKDLVVVEDNRSGVDVVRRWFVRDITNPKGGLPK
ncbi:MAG TPA: hypothetical protein VEC99_03965 [Clostridia bacterium]|nr:hypothetical protein [Clostridia bacterium]